MDNLLAKIYQSSKTVLTIKDLALIWNEVDVDNLKSKASYYVRHGDLMRLTRGVFAKNKDYGLRELAGSLYVPSYISFETVLRDAGVIFQHYDAIFVATKWTRNVVMDGHEIVFRKLKDLVLYNTTGVTYNNNCNIASTERAFLDMIYLFPNYYFDNLSAIDWSKCKTIAKIYNNQQLIKRLAEYQKKYK